VVKQLLKCPKGGRIDTAIFTFAGSSAIDDAMITLAGAERTVRVVLDQGQSTESKTWSAAQWLQEGGVEVLVPRHRPRLRKHTEGEPDVSLIACRRGRLLLRRNAGGIEADRGTRRLLGLV